MDSVHLTLYVPAPAIAHTLQRSPAVWILKKEIGAKMSGKICLWNRFALLFFILSTASSCLDLQPGTRLEAWEDSITDVQLLWRCIVKQVFLAYITHTQNCKSYRHLYTNTVKKKYTRQHYAIYCMCIIFRCIVFFMTLYKVQTKATCIRMKRGCLYFLKWEQEWGDLNLASSQSQTIPLPFSCIFTCFRSQPYSSCGELLFFKKKENPKGTAEGGSIPPPHSFVAWKPCRGELFNWFCYLCISYGAAKSMT